MSFILKKHKSAIQRLDQETQNRQFHERLDRTIRQSSRNRDYHMKLQLNENKFAINRTLKIKREQLQNSIRSSIYKLNTTISWAKQAQHHLEDTQKSQIKINSKNNAKLRIVIDKETIKLKNQANCKDLSCPKRPKDDGFVAQNNLFCVKQETVICYEDVFHMYRLGNTLTYYDKKIYIYGGHSFKGLTNNINLHYYDLKIQAWKKVAPQQGQLPYLCTCYHTSEQYKNYLIFIGGISIDSLRNRRYFNFQITLFDLQQQSWSKIRWNHSLRSHASTLYGNMLMIYGGINEKDEYLNKVFFISLNMSNIQQSTIMQYTTPTKPKAGIAFHKIVNTYDLESNLKDRIELEGIISYGGKFFDGSVCSDASVFRLNFKGRESFSYSKTEPEDCNGWEILSLRGKRPEGRYDHSMNILNKKGICLIVGGMNEVDDVLRDVWIMDLCSFSWVQAEFDANYDILKKGITGHSSTCDDNTVYIFGGMRSLDSETSTKFFSINFAVARTNNERGKINGEDSMNRTRFSKKFTYPFEEDNHS